MGRTRVGIIGCGAMAVYALKWLIAKSVPVSIEIFEAADDAGTGMPYRQGVNADYMLCNAFSREIPPVTRSLIAWLESRPQVELSEWELSTHDLNARAFYPRSLIGEYLESEFRDLCEIARQAGYDVQVHTGSTVTDVTLQGDTATLVCDTGQRNPQRAFDVVIIATGHRWPAEPTIDDARLVSPWPSATVEGLPEGRIGVLGSSLSAIDVVIALGHAHGRFEEYRDKVEWFPHNPESALRITMVSRTGVMPEGDFYYPFPYAPLEHLTKEALEQEIARGDGGLLQRVFALLCAELDAADPAYLDGLGPDARTIEGFAPSYFSHRREISALAAAKEGLANARKSMNNRETVAHRYALLRGHETFGNVLRHLGDADYRRFGDHLMPVFADCYAAVPHLSLARIVALYDAGVLELLATCEGARFTQAGDGPVTVETEDGERSFEVMVDARGQAPAPLHELPFPSLTAQLPTDEGPILEPFRLPVRGADAAPIYCLAMPQLLERYPFSQGLANCDALARLVVDDIGARQVLHCDLPKAAAG